MATMAEVSAKIKLAGEKVAETAKDKGSDPATKPEPDTELADGEKTDDAAGAPPAEAPKSTEPPKEETPEPPEPKPKTAAEMSQDPKDAVDDSLVAEMSAGETEGAAGTVDEITGPEKSRTLTEVADDFRKAADQP